MFSSYNNHSKGKKTKHQVEDVFRQMKQAVFPFGFLNNNGNIKALMLIFLQARERDGFRHSAYNNSFIMHCYMYL